MKRSNRNKSNSDSEIKVGPSINRNVSHFSANLENMIKNLSSPRFLGSIHLKNNELNNKNSSMENLVDNEINLRLSKSLKNTLINPLTKILILAAILFNIFWFLSLYFF